MPVSAASTADTKDTAITNALTDADIIDTSKTGSINIYKYDETSAAKDGVYAQKDSSVTITSDGQTYNVTSTGQKDATVESALADYGIAGVEFSYIYCGEVEQYSYTASGTTDTQLVYEVDDDLAEILGLPASDAKDMTAEGVANKCTNDKLHYTSDQLQNALTDILESDNIDAKNKLENYAENHVTGAFAETDTSGHTSASNLALGLYLIVETKVPEEVYLTTDPWFISLPFEVTGDDGDTSWNYEAYCYPKNKTSSPTIKKTVRQAYGSESYKDFEKTADKDYVISADSATVSKSSNSTSNNSTNNTTQTENSTSTGTEATFIAGQSFYSVLPNKTYFKKASSKPSDDVISGATVVSTDDSDCPIYLYVDGDVVYWYSEAETVYLNSSAYQMFYNKSTFIEIDMSGIDTSRTTDMHHIFHGCSALTTLDVSGFDTGNVTNMSWMFSKCRVLTTLDVSSFDTGKVTDMGWMFQNCYALTTLDLSGFDTGKVTNMNGIFFSCPSLTALDVSGFDTGNVTNMLRMFYNCSSLTTIYAGSGWDVSNVTDSRYMFSDCPKLRNYDSSVVDKTKANYGSKGYLTLAEGIFVTTTTASAGDVLDFAITSAIPRTTSTATYFSDFTIKDKLSKGLQYTGNIAIFLRDETETWTEITDKTTITPQTESDGTTTLTVSFTQEGLDAINAAGVKGNCSVEVRYTATASTDFNALVLGDEGNENNVSLTWQRTNEDYSNTIEDRCYVYSYGLDLTKYFSDNDGDASKVQFLLYNKTNGYYVVSDHKNGGTYCVGGSGDAAGTQIGKTASRDKATVFTPDTSGNLSILGLEADVYDLIEIATDDGYKLLSDPVRITIYTAIRQIRAAQAGYVGNDAATHTHTDACKDANGYLICGQMVQETANGRTIGKTAMYVGEVETATAYVDGMETTLATDTANSSANAKVMLEITNTKAYFFPLTGANGTLLFTLAGCAVAIVCISIIMKGKRKENQAG